MPVRPLRPTDVVGLASLHRQAGSTEITAHTWPLVEPDSDRLPLLGLAGASFGTRVAGRRVWVAQADGRLVALVSAWPRAGGLAWDVEHLHADPQAEDAAVELLERVVATASSRAARRVFLATSEEGRGQDVGRRAGFERYASATALRLERGFKVSKTDVFEARPRLRADEQALFQLYSAAVPAPVRAAEAMTLEEWQGLHRGSRAWRPTLTGTRQQLVWELGTSIVGWMEMVYGERSQFVDLLVHPRYEDAADRLVRYALLQASPKAPVYAVVRDYQSGVAPALQGAGFTPVARLDLHVKMLAVRVPERVLAPARLVGS